MSGRIHASPDFTHVNLAVFKALNVIRRCTWSKIYFFSLPEADESCWNEIKFLLQICIQFSKNPSGKVIQIRVDAVACVSGVARRLF